MMSSLIRSMVAMGAMALALGGSVVSAQELRFSWWGGGERHEAFLKAIKLFEAKNPGVKKLTANLLPEPGKQKAPA